MEIVFFLEEQSAKAFLDEFLPKILPSNVSFMTIPHQGKHDLQRSLPKKLRAWRNPEARFVILHDKDSHDCVALKEGIRQICQIARPDLRPLIRIACHELEAWYLGDFDALEAAFTGFNAQNIRGRAKYRDVDAIVNAAEELIKLVPQYQKVGGSRRLGPVVRSDRNTSASFQAFVTGVQSLLL